MDNIIARNKYKLIIHTDSCLGTSDAEVLEINKSKNVATFTYYDYSLPDGPQKKIKQINWNDDKEKVLRKLFEVGLSLKDSEGFCTTTSKYKLIGGFNKVKFSDLTCSVNEVFRQLIE